MNNSSIRMASIGNILSTPTRDGGVINARANTNTSKSPRRKVGTRGAQRGKQTNTTTPAIPKATAAQDSQ